MKKILIGFITCVFCLAGCTCKCDTNGTNTKDQSSSTKTNESTKKKVTKTCTAYDNGVDIVIKVSAPSKTKPVDEITMEVHMPYESLDVNGKEDVTDEEKQKLMDSLSMFYLMGKGVKIDEPKYKDDEILVKITMNELLFDDTDAEDATIDELVEILENQEEFLCQ